jgi:hypothetical protein
MIISCWVVHTYPPCTQPIMCFKLCVDLGHACGMWSNPCAMVNQLQLTLTFFFRENDHVPLILAAVLIFMIDPI